MNLMIVRVVWWPIPVVSAVMFAGGSWNIVVNFNGVAQTYVAQRGQPQKATRWQILTYRDLTLGRSEQIDVERAFGKPIWAGAPEQELIESDGEKELWLEYENVGGFNGRTTVVVGLKSKVLNAILLYLKTLTKRQVVDEYGTDFIEREGKLGPCPTERQIRHFKPASKRDYPFFLVYPQHGLYVAVREDDSVVEIGYLIRCP